MRNGKKIDVHSSAFRNMLSGLPHGSPGRLRQPTARQRQFAGAVVVERQAFCPRSGVQRGVHAGVDPEHEPAPKQRSDQMDPPGGIEPGQQIPVVLIECVRVQSRRAVPEAHQRVGGRHRPFERRVGIDPRGEETA